jgi:hypothetical protein
MANNFVRQFSNGLRSQGHGQGYEAKGLLVMGNENRRPAFFFALLGKLEEICRQVQRLLLHQPQVAGNYLVSLGIGPDFPARQQSKTIYIKIIACFSGNAWEWAWQGGVQSDFQTLPREIATLLS